MKIWNYIYNSEQKITELEGMYEATGVNKEIKKQLSFHVTNGGGEWYSLIPDCFSAVYTTKTEKFHHLTFMVSSYRELSKIEIDKLNKEFMRIGNTWGLL